MEKQKSLVLDLLDWKQTYRALSTAQQFILIGLIGLQIDIYLDFLLRNSMPHGNYGVLEFVYQTTHNPILAIAVDVPFMLGTLYLAFWFLKKGNENSDIWAIFLFAVTLVMPGLF
jgi:FtsH-binding integral membrane protein